MRTAKEIQADIRELRAEMKRDGVRKTSFMNGGLTSSEYRCNARLFRLNTELADAKKRTG